PSRAFSIDGRSVTSPSAYSTLRSAMRRRSLVGRTSTRTVSPRAHRAAAVLLPRKPLAPVTRQVIAVNSDRSAPRRAKMASSYDDDRRPHGSGEGPDHPRRLRAHVETAPGPDRPALADGGRRLARDQLGRLRRQGGPHG